MTFRRGAMLHRAGAVPSHRRKGVVGVSPPRRSRTFVPGIPVPLPTALDRNVVLVGILGALLAFASGAPLHAQDAGPPVPPGHWSHDLLELLDAAGAASSWMSRIDVVPAPVVRAELVRVIEYDLAPGRLLEGWLARFDREFPSRDGGPPLSTSLEIGVRSGEGYLDPGGGAYARASGSWVAHPRLALWGALDSGSGRRIDGVVGLGVATVVGPFALQAGRLPLAGVGPGLTSVQLGAGTPLDVVLVTTRRRLILPGLERLSGLTAWQFGLGPWERVGDLREGWVAIGSTIFQPHERLELGFSRVARFGGDDAPAFTPRRFARMVSGIQNRPMDWDDQKLELTARFRWRVARQSVVTYLVLAQEDSPIWKDPGILVGAHLPFLTGWGVLGLRHEYTAYGPRARWCPFCEDTRGEGEHRIQGEWFDHVRQGLYLRSGLPAGDPLGGYGAGHTTALSVFPATVPIRGTVRTFFQVREEGNLLLERWPGKRRGVEVELDWEPRSGMLLKGSTILSHGPTFGWEPGWVLSGRVLWGG